jgi:hemerythrin superfamily protein
MLGSGLSRTIISKEALKLHRLHYSRQHFVQIRFFVAAASENMPRITDAIKKDHRELEAYYNTIVKSGDPDQQTRFQNQFTWELARHSISEELVVYPAFERYLKGGSAIAEKDRHEHQIVCPTVSSLFSISHCLLVYENAGF